MPDRQEVARASQHGNLLVPFPIGDGLAAHGHGNHQAHLANLTSNGQGVLKGQVIGSSANPRHGAGGLGVARYDDDQVRSKGLKLTVDVAPGAFSDGGQQGDCGHSYGDAQDNIRQFG